MRFSFTPLPLAAIIFAAVSFAQDTTATIAGQVQDPTGAGIARAKVTAKNIQTGLERSVNTSESSDYTLPLLPIGTYEVTAEKEGFKKLIEKVLSCRWISTRGSISSFRSAPLQIACRSLQRSR